MMTTELERLQRQLQDDERWAVKTARYAAEEAESAMNALRDCRLLLTQLCDEGYDMTQFAETIEQLGGEASDLEFSARQLYKALRNVS